MDTTESSAPHAHPSTEVHDDTVEAHYTCLVHLQDRCWAMSCSAAYESAERTTRPLVNAHKASLSITQKVS
jgi:hypothetical protein